MKLLMIVIDSECREELEVLFKRVGVSGYTEIPEVHGVGETGIRMGSGAFPATSSLFFTVVEAEKVQELKETLNSFCGAFDRHFKMVQWGVEEVV
ncbi:MAG: hypothetical protein DRJ65_17905 [Acidobacteria bacterium]|nr:MAG: hypothetical protein DRJ65_17905 [Acidobacteriota bacterium]